jgi:hypothetical protein
MLLLLVEKYSKRNNWRGYCCDETTEALTQRGWLGIDDITEQDTILSYDMTKKKLKWSKIKSIYRYEYQGNMFHLTVNGMDALVSPGHKFITESGPKQIELLDENDQIILMANTEILDFDFQHYGFLPREHMIYGDHIDFHGANQMVRKPTIPYKGRVWCPETEYGTFMARRNGTIWLSSNSYNDEMRGNALMQLADVALLFNEAKSDVPNPFAFYTTIIKNSFTRILNNEKKVQHIRDDLLIMHDKSPSHTRHVENEMEQRSEDTVEKVVFQKKRGRKSKYIITNGEG